MADFDIVERIYEASLVPELWPDILDMLARETDSKGGLLLTTRDKLLSWTSTDNLQDDFQSYINDGYFTRCGRRVCLFKKAHSEFLTEKDYWTSEELDKNEIYNSFFRPRNLGWSAGTGLQTPTGERIVISVERSHDRGNVERSHVDRLNSLRPHLARSALMATRLGLKSAKNSGETLEKLGLPTIVVDKEGGAVEAKNLPDYISEQIIWGAGNRPILKDDNANALLKSGLQQLESHAGDAVQSFAVKGTDERPALVAHLIPISRSAHDIFANSYALLAFTPVSAKRVPAASVIRSLFDLTASEARVARGLAAGQTADEIADEGGVSLATVRTQIRKVMEKTACSRQAEVVALMANITLER